MSVPPSGSTRPSPRVLLRLAAGNGLLRQASRMTSRSLVTPSSWRSTVSSAIASKLDVGRRRQRRINGDQVVAPAHLDAVAGEEHHPQLCPGGRARHLAQCVAEAVELQVLAQDHRVEFELALEGLGHRLGIVHRVRQPPDLVVGVADHQGHALLGAGGGQAGEGRNRTEQPNE